MASFGLTDEEIRQLNNLYYNKLFGEQYLQDKDQLQKTELITADFVREYSQKIASKGGTPPPNTTTSKTALETSLKQLDGLVKAKEKQLNDIASGIQIENATNTSTAPNTVTLIDNTNVLDDINELRKEIGLREAKLKSYPYNPELYNLALNNAAQTVERYRAALEKTGQLQQLTQVQGNEPISAARQAIENAVISAANKLENLVGIGNESYQENARENRLSEQAALILMMKEILPKITKQKEPNESPVTDATTKQYKNFSPIRFTNNPSDTATGHFFLTSNFTKSPNMDVFFRSIPPQVLSMLIPSIKLYKVFYREGEEIKNGYDWRVPFDNVPVRFNNEKDASEFVINDPESVLNGNGGFRNAGIKSFAYDYVGVNPAEINTNIKARLELFFQSPAELVQRVYFNFDDSRFITRPPDSSNQQLSFAYSDLINQSSRFFKDPTTGEQLINEQYYRLKIECGYASINEAVLNDVLENSGYGIGGLNINGVQLTGEQYRRAIINAIKSTKVVLFLSPWKYDVKFNEDSTVGLTIEFTAAMDSMMISNEADIFKLTNESKQIDDIVRKFDLFLKDLDKEKKIEEHQQPNYDCIDIKKLNEYIESFKTKNNLTNLTNDQIISYLSNLKATAYNSLSSYLCGLDDIHESPPDESKIIRPKTYTAIMKPDILGIVPAEDKKHIEKDKIDPYILQKRIEAFKNGNQIIDVIPLFIDDERAQYNSVIEDAKKQAQVADASKKPENGKPSDLGENPLKSLDEKIKSTSAAEQYNIRFLLLGDILDVALNCLEQLVPKADAPKIVLGSIPIQIPKGNPQTFGSKVFYDWDYLYPNIADIPISFNLFQEFLIKNIVQANKTRYPVLQFIKDIIAQIVVPAINPAVFGIKNAINSSVRLSTTYFTFNAENGIDALTNRNTEERLYPPVLDNTIIDNLRSIRAKNGLTTSDPVTTAVSSTNNQNSPSPYVNYIFLYCSSRFPKNLVGDENDDIDKGVMHIRMGTDTGMVKRINFSTVNVPYQREMLAQREGKGQGTNLKQFYNADVEMFGNNIFRPGDYIYIHPNYMYFNKQVASATNTVSSPTDVAQASNASYAPLQASFGQQYIDLQDSLGIGGYYLVIDVHTSFDHNQMDYSTKLKCSFQAQKINGKIKAINEPCSDRK